MQKTNVQRYVHSFKLSKTMEESELMYRMTEYIFNVIGVNLNTAAFLTTIELLGNDEQVNKWRKMVLDGKIFGGYGQTELGHGSNVQGLETEAHYDEKKQTFRMNSPHITSAKYWPGNLGLNSTHNVIQAKTFVKGKSIGMQTFIF
jgi:alkylation response protein AidB-like acyl-CoA dehydrogenase